MKRVIGAPGSASFRRFRRLVSAANERRQWADDLDDAELSRAAREALISPGRSAVVEPTAYLLAVLRAAARRALGQEPFDEQLLASCALTAGNAVEMDTGEGKTLAGALAAAAFVIAGRRVHVLSVNDYLAQRDAQWMQPLFELLDISVGWFGQHTEPATRAEAYRRDVVYAPVSDVGYDVLRDRFVTVDANRVHPVLDVARARRNVHGDPRRLHIGRRPRELDSGVHYAIDADQATVSLTDAGLDLLENRLGGVNLYDTAHTATLTRINLALHARLLVRRDVDYLVIDDSIKLVNTARGRVAHQQRWPDGLHAAVEAKERLAVSSPGVVLDTLTVQDLLRRYTTLAGMSGTVVAVAEELAEF